MPSRKAWSTRIFQAEESSVSNSLHSNEIALKPSGLGLVLIYLVPLAVVFRTLAIEENRPLLAWYLGFELLYLLLYTVAFLIPSLPDWMKHLYFILQSTIVLYMLSWRPEFDFLVLLFFLLTYPASLFFTGRMRWVWIIAMVMLTGGSLIFYLGLVRGLALSLTTMAAEIVLPAFLIVNHETETARTRSQVLLNELQETHHRLQLYSSQVEGLAAMQERNRLARELHDTVSQLIFSINLTTRSAQLLLKKNPAHVSDQLNLLQGMTTDALSQLRSLITKLRPPQNPEGKS
jgi:signal transduction histidine kinase